MPHINLKYILLLKEQKYAANLFVKVHGIAFIFLVRIFCLRVPVRRL